MSQVHQPLDLTDSRNPCSYLSHFLPPLSASYHSEHHLRDVERVTPVVIGDVTVVLLDAGQPPAQDSVVDVEPAREVQIDEHTE